MTISTEQLTEALKELDGNGKAWSELPLTEKQDLLLELASRTGQAAERWVRASCEGKRILFDSPAAGEEWFTGPYAMINYAKALAETVGRLAEGRDPLEKVRIRTRADGRVTLRVLPYDAADRIFLNGYTAETWLHPGMTAADARAALGKRLRAFDRPDGIALVLGAGNINATAPLDVLYKMFSDNTVVLCKLNPVNDYMQPVLEDIFAPLIRRGFLRIVSGGTEVGSFLTGHETTTSIHITGSNGAHDAIVFGGGEEGRRRKQERTPVLRKPITSELGGVGAVVIVPGPWSEADLEFQAQNVAAMKLHNSGFNCTAAQVVVLPEEWEHADRFLQLLRTALDEAPRRPAYYPGAAQRVESALQAHPQAERLGDPAAPRLLVTGLDPTDTEEYLYRNECFAPVLGVTRLPGKDAAFLDAAVDFCNNRLEGTLGVNLLVHPATVSRLGSAWERAIGDLRFGAIAINAWTSVGYLTARANWGAFPGHELHDVGSGIGLSHNALLLDDLERTVITGPFRPFPRSVLKGEPALSPKPVWYVNNRTVHRTGQLATVFANRPSPARLPGIFLSAMRG